MLWQNHARGRDARCSMSVWEPGPARGIDAGYNNGLRSRVSTSSAFPSSSVTL